MIVHVDMDGVIADFDKGVRELEPDMTWDRENVDRVCEAYPHVFETLPEIPGAIEAVEMLKNSYSNIFFTSTPMCNVPHSYMGKRIWLMNKFGGWADKRLILTHRKDLILGDILIDDRITNGVEDFKGKHIHFGSEEFPDWNAVLKYLIF